MELNTYQKMAMTTCMPSSDNFAYMMLNLVGEVGEFSSKVAKLIRKDMVKIDNNRPVLCFPNPFTEDHEHMTPQDYDVDYNAELQKECGDILWQVAGLASCMGWELEDIARMNLDKLASRKQRGKIDGDGDNR